MSEFTKDIDCKTGNYILTLKNISTITGLDIGAAVAIVEFGLVFILGEEAGNFYASLSCVTPITEKRAKILKQHASELKELQQEMLALVSEKPTMDNHLLAALTTSLVELSERVSK